ncbi:hypothetical protein Poli38472_011544 [Pythium oligandrum]|uniref:Uncharacterized protein n=1 Tax=Pythium oligandrum TaxID=41045 RepID=A0A8K1FKX9_PYTOL|nr:hypothetical protein Poli38472_011544 [Pythium oligandrum]|eukprot:TMW64664.1 hypothetical protein Poli38472_011544 [Pythium oligandrum]
MTTLIVAVDHTTNSLQTDESVHKVDQVDPQAPDDDTIDLDDVALELVLRTKCFEGFEGKRTTFLYTTQLTCANVMSTVVTARPLEPSIPLRRRKGEGERDPDSNPLKPINKNQQESSGSVYAQSCNPKKAKKNGRYQAQLPALRRSMPSLPIPIKRLNEELIKEREKFMKQLHREREEKQKLDEWAARKIQACYRRFRDRPRVLTYETRQKTNTYASMRLELHQMESALKSADKPSTAAKPDTTGNSPWRKDVKSRAGRKRDIVARKEHMQHSATLIQACIKRFLVRFSYVRLLSRHYDEIYLRAVIKIQSVFRGYRLRAKITRIVSKLRSQAAIQIQSLIRGIQARKRVGTLKFEVKCEQLRREGKTLQFTLPNRPKDIVRTSSLRCLFEHRITREHLEFRNARWKEERLYLHIHKVTIKLNMRREWLLRLQQSQTPTSRQLKRRSRLNSGTFNRIRSSIGSSRASTPTSPHRGRVRTGSPSHSCRSRSSSPRAKPHV